MVKILDKIKRLEQYQSELEIYLAKSAPEAVSSVFKTLKINELILLYVGVPMYPIVIERLKSQFGLDLTDHEVQELFKVRPKPCCDVIQDDCSLVGELTVPTDAQGRR